MKQTTPPASSAFCIGIGILCALCFSPRFMLFIAAVFLICFGIGCRKK